MANSTNVKVTQLHLCYFQNINIHLKQVTPYLMIWGYLQRNIWMLRHKTFI